MVTMGMELSQRADGNSLDANARAAEGAVTMPKEYIERKRAIVDACNSLELYPSEYAKLEDALNRIPTANVVEVVRCKDCRLRGREECAMFYRCECGEQHTWETDNDFCSWGEKER